MSKLAAIVLAGLLGGLSCTAERHPVVEPGQAADGAAFRTWFERQSAIPGGVPAVVAEAARSYRYVFIAGFLNEGFRHTYFNENKRALVAAGVSSDAIDIQYPKSGSTVEENAAVLLQVIPDLAAKGPQKLVLIGHSKGAAETLAFAVRAAPFVRERVQAIFLVQGAFGGSGVADFIVGTGHPLDDRMPPVPRAAFKLAAAGGKLLDRTIDAGFQSMTHQHATELWTRLLPQATPRLPDGLAERIFFIRSQRAPDQACPPLWSSAWYLATYYGPNDGLLVVADQWIPGVGTLLADLDADHSGLTVAQPISNRPAQVRYAFTNALLMQLSGAFAH